MATRHAEAAFHRAATAMETAVDRALADLTARTRDLGGATACNAFGRRVAAELGGA